MGERPRLVHAVDHDVGVHLRGRVAHYGEAARGVDEKGQIAFLREGAQGLEEARRATVAMRTVAVARRVVADRLKPGQGGGVPCARLPNALHGGFDVVVEHQGDYALLYPVHLVADPCVADEERVDIGERFRLHSELSRAHAAIDCDVLVAGRKGPPVGRTPLVVLSVRREHPAAVRIAASHEGRREERLVGHAQPRLAGVGDRAVPGVAVDLLDEHADVVFDLPDGQNGRPVRLDNGVENVVRQGAGNRRGTGVEAESARQLVQTEPAALSLGIGDDLRKLFEDVLVPLAIETGGHDLRSCVGGGSVRRAFREVPGVGSATRSAMCSRPAGLQLGVTKRNPGIRQFRQECRHRGETFRAKTTVLPRPLGIDAPE